MLIIVSPVLAALLFLKLISFDIDGRFYIYGFAFLLIGALAGIRTGVQLRAPDAMEVLRRDPRPPIVFLRPFDEEQRVMEGNPVGKREGGEDPARSKGKSAYERTLAVLLRKSGPFIAIGRPGEPLATLGAARIYVADHEWKEHVEAMVRSAGAVILQPELSAGTLWEVELVAATWDRKRLLLIVPNPALRPLRYARIRDVVQERLGINLPHVEACPPCDAFYFDDSGRPVPLLLETPRFWISPPQWFWRFVGAGKEEIADAVRLAPQSLLVSSPQLARAAKPFLDRLAAANSGGTTR